MPKPEMSPDAPPPREGCFAKKTCLEKLMIVVLCIICVILLSAGIAFCVYFFFSRPPVEICLTEHCVQAGAGLKARMDEKADPCNDFYQFACGGWMTKHDLALGETHEDYLTTLQGVNRNRLLDLLMAKPAKNATEFKVKPRAFFKACLDEDILEKRGNGHFLKMVRSVGKFPTLDADWNDTATPDLTTMLAELAKLGQYPLFTARVDDLHQTGKLRIHLSAPALSLPVDQYSSDEKVKARAALLTDYLVLLGADRGEAEADVGDVMALEGRLAGIQRHPILGVDESTTNNPMDIKELQDTYTWADSLAGSFDWLKFFQTAVKMDIGDPAPLVQVLDRVINTEPEYMAELTGLMAGTDDRTLMNYLLSRLLEYARHLGPDYEALYNDYTYTQNGLEIPDRKDSCMKKTIKIFPESVSRLYVDKYFSKESKKEVVELVADLKESFLGLLGENHWMKDQTKEMAHVKLKRMSSKIGYPDDLLSDKKLNDQYQKISAKDTQYFETVVDAQRLSTYLNWRSLSTPDQQSTGWEDGYPITDDAFYRIMENELFFPAAFMQDPVYNPGFTKSMIYGRLGFVIARELTHGFDKAGYKYDHSGKEKTWFSDMDKRKFDAQSKCFVDQYGCYKWHNTPLNGEMTLAENIADNGGLKQSFRAYRNLIHRRGVEESRLPGLTEMNHDQIFFLSFAQLMCSKTDDTYMEQLLTTNTFAPNDRRVYGALQNSDDFAHVFNCPARSRMNRADKCELW